MSRLDKSKDTRNAESSEVDDHVPAYGPAVAQAVVTTMIDHLNFGVMVLDARLHLLYRNPSAERHMAAIPLHVDLKGKFLTHRTPSGSSAISFFRQCLQSPSIQRASLVTCETPAAGTLTLVGLPHTGAQLETDAGPLSNWLCVMSIADDELIDSSVDIRARDFLFTRAETKVLRKLLGGSSVKEAARELGLQEATARNHLARMLSKSGARGQADLLRRFLLRRIPVTLLKDGNGRSGNHD